MVVSFSVLQPAPLMVFSMSFSVCPVVTSLSFPASVGTHTFSRHFREHFNVISNIVHPFLNGTAHSAILTSRHHRWETGNNILSAFQVAFKFIWFLSAIGPILAVMIPPALLRTGHFSGQGHHPKVISVEVFSFPYGASAMWPDVLGQEEKQENVDH